MHTKFTLLAALFTFALSAAVWADDDEDLGGHAEINGYRIVAPADYPPQPREGDAGPTQIFEILRPDNNRAITLSRLLTTCECVTLEADQASFYDGERAFLRLRNVKPTEGQLYTFYVQVSSPESILLKHETFVKSDIPPEDE